MIKSTDCSFMFCLPITQEQFRLDELNHSKHFVREHLPQNKPKEFEQGGLWAVYEREVVNPYLKLKTQFSRYGFSFVDSTSFQRFSETIKLFSVNILFSHCNTKNNDCIEFFDKMVIQKEFVESIPENFDKVIDLSVCNPQLLARQLKEQRRLAIVKSSNKSISLMHWLYFYGIVFEIILNEEIEFYSNAIELAITKIYTR